MQLVGKAIKNISAWNERFPPFTFHEGSFYFSRAFRAELSSNIVYIRQYINRANQLCTQACPERTNLLSINFLIFIKEGLTPQYLAQIDVPDPILSSESVLAHVSHHLSRERQCCISQASS